MITAAVLLSLETAHPGADPLSHLLLLFAEFHLVGATGVLASAYLIGRTSFTAI
jgi:hypothetical protein